MKWHKRAVALCALCAVLQTGCATEVKEPTRGVLSAEASENSVTLRWESVEGADRYRLYRKSAGESDYRFICDVTDGNTYVDEYAQSSDMYSYKFIAYSNAAVLAYGLCENVDLLDSPAITDLRQTADNSYDVEWSVADRECVLYGETSSGWIELGRSKNGALSFENTAGCTAVAVSTTAQDGTRSEPVPVPDEVTVVSATALDLRTNAIEIETREGEWRYEFARSDTENGNYVTVGSGENGFFYDVSDKDNATECFYRCRMLGDRAEGAWSDPVRLGTNERDVLYVPVIVYHEFLTEDEMKTAEEFEEDVISPDEFESDLVWLKAHGYTTITTAHLADYLEGKSDLPAKPIILTIDDGKYGVYKHAWPLLMKYGMTGSLAVIGSMIDSASAAPAAREKDPAPYCTWDEIGEMHASGAMEIVSHTQSMHAFYHDDRQGANCAEGETAQSYLKFAQPDANAILGKISEITGATAAAMAYPYSLRCEESDKAWLAAGYRILLCGNNEDVHSSKWNPMIREAGLNPYSARLRRIGRITDTSIGKYLSDYEDLLSQGGEG